MHLFISTAKLGAKTDKKTDDVYMTHVCCPVHSSSVLLVKCVNCCSSLQQQLCHLHMTEKSPCNWKTKWLVVTLSTSATFEITANSCNGYSAYTQLMLSYNYQCLDFNLPCHDITQLKKTHARLYWHLYPTEWHFSLLLQKVQNLFTVLAHPRYAEKMTKEQLCAILTTISIWRKTFKTKFHCKLLPNTHDTPVTPPDKCIT